jgi:hypothetical protein
MKFTEYGPPLVDLATFDMFPEQKALEKTIWSSNTTVVYYG